MMQTATYSAVPQPSDARRHQIPVEVIRYVTSKTGDVRCALDGVPCLLTILIATRDRIEHCFAPVIAKPVSGGEIRIGSRLVQGYPATFRPGQFLIATIAPLE